MSKFQLNSGLEFDPELFNDECLFDFIETLDPHNSGHCEELIIEPLEDSDDGDSSSEFDITQAEVEKSEGDESDDINDDDSLYCDLGYSGPSISKTSPWRLVERKRLLKLFGRNPRKGYHLVTTPEKIIFEKRFGLQDNLIMAESGVMRVSKNKKFLEPDK